MRRVAVTGMGIVSCLGNSAEEVTRSLYEGKSGISTRQEQIDMGMRSHIAGAPDIDTAALIDRKQLRFMGDAAAFAAAVDGLAGPFLNRGVTAVVGIEGGALEHRTTEIRWMVDVGDGGRPPGRCGQKGHPESFRRPESQPRGVSGVDAVIPVVGLLEVDDSLQLRPHPVEDGGRGGLKFQKLPGIDGVSRQGGHGPGQGRQANDDEKPFRAESLPLAGTERPLLPDHPPAAFPASGGIFLEGLTTVGAEFHGSRTSDKDDRWPRLDDKTPMWIPVA